jgi:hypothetical protein
MACFLGVWRSKPQTPWGSLSQFSFATMCAVALAKPRRLFRMSRSRRASGVGSAMSAGKSSRLLLGGWISECVMLEAVIVGLSTRPKTSVEEKGFYPLMLSLVIGGCKGTSDLASAFERVAPS